MAFCVDNYPEVSRQLSDGMTRDQKVNVLFTHISTNEIVDRLLSTFENENARILFSLKPISLRERIGERFDSRYHRYFYVVAWIAIGDQLRRIFGFLTSVVTSIVAKLSAAVSGLSTAASALLTGGALAVTIAGVTFTAQRIQKAQLPEATLTVSKGRLASVGSAKATKAEPAPTEPAPTVVAPLTPTSPTSTPPALAPAPSGARKRDPKPPPKAVVTAWPLSETAVRPKMVGRTCSYLLEGKIVNGVCWKSETPITQLQYALVIEKNPSTLKDSPSAPIQVHNVMDAVVYVNALSKREHLKPCYKKDADGYTRDFFHCGYWLEDYVHIVNWLTVFPKPGTFSIFRWAGK